MGLGGGDRIRPAQIPPFDEGAGFLGPLQEHADRVGRVLSVEMSMGQMVEDVRAAVGRDIPVEFFGRTGGIVPSPDEVIAKIKELVREAVA